MIYSIISWECAVECYEMPFKPLWNVISSTSRMNHSSHVLEINQIVEVTRFFQAVEALHFNHGSEEFICDLVSPTIYLWKIDIINKECHLLPSWRTKYTAHSFVN